MSSHDQYPQDYPDHLSEDNDVGYCNGTLPAGHTPLLFESMSFEQFEQLCWWLIKKDHQVVGCQLLGAPGIDQDGIDIFAFDYLVPSELVVYECKCWQEFRTEKLKEAVTKFLDGRWASYAKSFTLIVAQKSIGKLANEWRIQRDRLHKAGINAELWTGNDLTEKIQRFPDILSKFFPAADHTFFGNEWMQRVGFIEKLHKALVDPRAGIAQMAKNFLEISRSDESKLTVEHRSKDSWSLKRPWLDLNFFLPEGKFYPSSAMVILKRDDLTGASISFDQKWLLNNFIGTPGAPLEHQFRPFINGVVPDLYRAKDKYIIDLKNCRCALSTEGAMDLAYAADRLSAVFMDSLKKKELVWGATDFPFANVGDIRVVICTMPKWLWEEILKFSQQHDYESGDTDWHIFHAALGCLIPYSKESNAKYKRGHHGIFYVSEKLDGLTYGDNVALLWSAPDAMFHDIVSPQGWWSCENAFNWLQKQLIPEVGKWITRRSFNEAKFFFSRRRKKFELLNWWSENARIEDVRIKSLLPNQRYKSIGLLAIVEILQSYFNSSSRDFISAEDMETLYRALIVLLRWGRGHPRYIAGNLSIHSKVETHSEIIQILEQRISSNYLKENLFSVDYTLRAMMGIIGDEDSWVSETELNLVFEALNSFMRHYDLGMLRKRHSKWI